MKFLNEGLRFILELCLLAALSHWGFHIGNDKFPGWIGGIGIPLTAAVIWGTFIAPKASIPVSDPYRLILELALFGAASWALISMNRPVLGITLILLFIINRILLKLLE